MEKVVCPRCGNTDQSLFYQGSKGVYCRACISFSRYLVSETKQENWDDYPADLTSEYTLDFALTEHQKRVSHEIVEKMKRKDVLVWAVTGSGKTELCMEFIKECLSQRKRIGIVIARRQVVLELAERFRHAFQCDVIPVCEGYTSKTEADLIILTAHQCYRYFEKKFDHLIVDEPDAFPYAGNAVLQGIVRNSCKGTMLYLTATPDQQLLDHCEVIELFSRPHGFDLPVPHVKTGLLLSSLIRLLVWLKKRVAKNIPFLLFVPTIKTAKVMTLFLKTELKVECCTSKTENKDDIIFRMKQKQLQGLVCTTILERGVTFDGIDVIVWNADHVTYTQAALVQISGRVGRKLSRPTGDCTFLCFSKSQTVLESVRMIEHANKMSHLSKEAA